MIQKHGNRDNSLLEVIWKKEDSETKTIRIVCIECEEGGDKNGEDGDKIEKNWKQNE